jgi:hypothetical protein
MGSERKENQRHRSDNRAHPETLHREIIDVRAAVDRWPEQALQAALAASRRIREAERLHGAELKTLPAILSSEK